MKIIALFLLTFGMLSDVGAASAIPRLSPLPAEVELLDGTWKFSPTPKSGFEGLTAVEDWSDIQVPGQWVMQGFHVEPDTAAGYFRTFEVAEDWKGKRIKLRFDAVYSDATVFVNGTKAGAHLGGFTAFELDITDQVHFGKRIPSCWR
ncbi:MAG: hypothetical protein HC888_03560 [Candidatus Competibacteraceae bacterium]|nr:hypothetical protein [Candidatus Competibacteraceae bacterium]